MEPQGNHLTDAALSKISGIQIDPAEPQQQEGEQPAQEQELEAQDSEATQPDSETEEIELEDFKFALPKTHAQKVREALMRNADYTQKSKLTAERERAIEAREAAFRAQTDFHQQSLDDIASIKALDTQLAEFKKVNWAQLGTEDMMRTKLYHDQLKEQRDNAIRSFEEKRQKFSLNLAENLKNLEKSSYQEITLKIPGFNEKAKGDLKKYILEKGYSEDAAARMFLNPIDVELIYKAQQFDALQASKPQIQNRANSAPPVVKPGAATNAMPQDTKLKLALSKEKDPQKRQKLGQELLARKLGIR